MSIEEVEAWLAKNRKEAEKHREEQLERERKCCARAMVYLINT